MTKNSSASDSLASPSHSSSADTRHSENSPAEYPSAAASDVVGRKRDFRALDSASRQRGAARGRNVFMQHDELSNSDDTSGPHEYSRRYSRPRAASGALRRWWKLKVSPDALDLLREHPHFDWQNAAHGGHTENSYEVSPSQEILLSHTVVEDDREPLFHLEMLRLFRQRLRVLAVMGLALLPLFHLFYAMVSPNMAREALVPHGLMLATCAAYLFLAPRIKNLVWARLLTVAGYALICTGASLVMIILGQSQFDDGATRNLQFVVLAAHAQILLSVVMLPLSLWESLVMAGIVASTLAWSAWWIFLPDATPMRNAQLFVLLTTAVFVLCIAHFQSLLRRRAFDAAFDLARSAAQLQTLSTLDAVTGGWNRLYLEKTLTLEINRAARFGHPLSILMFDLDNFKAVNDTRGHTAGDEVLRAIWQVSAGVVRDVDTAARYGGDEFLIILPETETTDAREIATRLQQVVGEEFHERFGKSGPESAVTLSIGIVTLHPDAPLPLEEVISRADERLYEAKRSGKNRIAF